MDRPSPLSRVRIVLVSPETPANVGAAARAMKTMGLSRLVVVAPACDVHSAEAVRLAHNAEDVLANLEIVPTLDAALADVAFSAATTNRVRRAGLPFDAPEQLATRLLPIAEKQSVAIVFGRESSGLTTEEVVRCSVASTIPSATTVPALNLAQAVMVYCYALYQASLTTAEREYEWSLAEQGEVEPLYRHLASTLERLEGRPAVSMDLWIDKFRRILARVPLERRDVALLHKFLSIADRAAVRRPSTADERSGS
ncbi:MAG TPA: RNA methyltransferase [Pirellulales bacterium]